MVWKKKIEIYKSIRDVFDSILKGNINGEPSILAKVNVNFLQEPEVIHPLTGERLKLEKQALKNLLENINFSKMKNFEFSNDFRKTFYELWWNIPKYLAIPFIIPENPKIPFSSIIDYLDNLSAQSITDNLSLLLVSIGPVQEFIAAARSTIDLKMGSYLLSYLVFQGIKVIGEGYGYDNIIFPYMRGSYFVKKEFEKFGIKVSNYLAPSVASLPNVFTAIVPTDELQELKKKIEIAVKTEMQQISDFVKSYVLKNRIIGNQQINLLDRFSKSWDKQIAQFPTIIMVEQEMGNLKEIVEQHFEYTKDENIKKLFESIETLGIPEQVFYGVFSELLGIKSALRKATRDFIQVYENSIQHGDDLSGENKSLVEILTKYGNEEKKEKLSAISTIKRFFVNYLEKIGYKEAYEKLKTIKSTEEIAGKYKIAALIMDGDNMGKWISGKLAPSMKNRVHTKVIEYFEKNQSNEIKNLKNLRLISPSYQRTISRTLNNFANFVPKIVEEFDGLLIYAGGDDVLALFPSNKVFEAANKIRKVYSGIGNIKIDNFIFKDGWCYINDEKIPLFNMMGKKLTMSVGISIANSKFNLKMLLNLARNMEKLAKSNVKNGREKSSFAVATIRRSGQIKESKIFWEVNDYDVINEAQNFIKKYESKKSMKRVVIRIMHEFENFGVPDNIISLEEFKGKVIPFIAEKIFFNDLCDEKFLDIKDKEEFEEYLRVLENLEYARKENENED
ncbi:CRISPR-associated protein Crm2 [Thermosipho melanesiensis]|uniref:CRISPR-associated protein, Crm2 family n=2 Tax=Thermosipho melanesiensis TaxID=46541 RepID=A6LNK1_THEM4|nr:type III-B CRISPR-associated protein Cas10/Cmr2 [Thermosipho melanesiensis]ABR31502.1 CRISPR-associated protein, Crm2 family [Thermosipho melanesiensis BI429]APT74555.1 CRISPR-associated protein Crm2 [Thermosipho melanesiensis]OOC35470.1 CRISPR-associated protein Crm2 [Thermosipho melanesiensis]OOC36507.1 CRISPR-associated protein Crm2 [Thermosipho melanesiensis]OOC36830.1 CRISPR-associated protein Crm2 [Thermosipho melanesiensis]